MGRKRKDRSAMAAILFALIPNIETVPIILNPLSWVIKGAAFPDSPSHRFCPVTVHVKRSVLFAGLHPIPCNVGNNLCQSFKPRVMTSNTITK